ncbi:MAG: rhodanese-like domain-containing protein [Verrucomicrobiota bacterium JB023]|nr:rhodanese-like domain-containing protein [Verrucomicrobiota bacterium JB023]
MKAFLSIVAGLIAMTAFASAGQFPDISIEELDKAIKSQDKKVVVIDVNGSKSYKKGHIPTAIDFAATKDIAEALPSDKSTLIVAYCGGPKCGAYMKAAKKAESLGYTNVAHLSAGISGWKEAGKKIAVN